MGHGFDALVGERTDQAVAVGLQQVRPEMNRGPVAKRLADGLHHRAEAAPEFRQQPGRDVERLCFGKGTSRRPLFFGQGRRPVASTAEQPAGVLPLPGQKTREDAAPRLGAAQRRRRSQSPKGGEHEVTDARAVSRPRVARGPRPPDQHGLGAGTTQQGTVLRIVPRVAKDFVQDLDGRLRPRRGRHGCRPGGTLGIRSGRRTGRPARRALALTAAGQLRRAAAACFSGMWSGPASTHWLAAAFEDFIDPRGWLGSQS